MCSEEVKRLVIQYFCSENVPEAEVHRRLSVQHGSSALLSISAYEWCTKREQETHPPDSSSSRDASGELANGHRWGGLFLQIRHRSVYEIIHESLRFRRVCTRWVSRELNKAHKRNRVICQSLLERYNHEDHFLRESEREISLRKGELCSSLWDRIPKRRALTGNI